MSALMVPAARDTNQKDKHMTSDKIRETARMHRTIADLMDEVVDLRAKYSAMCGEASDAIAKQRAAEQALERERAAVVRMDKEIGDWTRICDERDAARNRADAAEKRVKELEAAAEGAVLAAIPGIMAKVAKRIDLACLVETLKGSMSYAEQTGFFVARNAALSAVENLRQHPKDALPEGGGE